MARAIIRLIEAVGVLACFVGVCHAAEGQKVYRYTDAEGRVIYSDHAPGPSGKNVQIKKLGQNLIESETPIGTRIAQDRFPVTLYTFACGELCERGEGLLNRRGVPFARVDVTKQAGADRLKRLTGEMQAPVLQVGDKLIAKGFNEPLWQSLLNEAGYPKTPPPRRTQPAASAATATPSPASSVQAEGNAPIDGKAQADGKAAASGAAQPQPKAPPAPTGPGSGYPR